jgi:hypothetical protein
MKYGEGDMTLLKSVFFIVDTDFYVKIFENLRTPEEYNNECKKIGAQNFLENYYMNQLKNYTHLLTIDNTDEEKLFNNDNINIFSGVEYLNVIPVKDQPNSFVIWFNSSNKNDNRRVLFEYKKNDGTKESVVHTIKSRSYYYKKFTINNGESYEIVADIFDFDNKQSLSNYKFNIDINNIGNLSENGLFTEK